MNESIEIEHNSTAMDWSNVTDLLWVNECRAAFISCLASLSLQGEVSSCARLDETVQDAEYIFECVFESLELKQNLFQRKRKVGQQRVWHTSNGENRHIPLDSSLTASGKKKKRTKDNTSPLVVSYCFDIVQKCDSKFDVVLLSLSREKRCLTFENEKKEPTYFT